MTHAHTNAPRSSRCITSSSLYHLYQPPSRNFSSPVVNTACVLFRQARPNGGRRKSLAPLRARSEGGERKRKRAPRESGLGESELERCELRGHLVVKMKAPPLIAAPFVRGRRNRPIDSRIYRGGGMIQPGRSTTTLATADDS